MRIVSWSTVSLVTLTALLPTGSPALAQSRGAPPIQVTTTVDELTQNGLCSLREAIQLVNGGIAGGGDCALTSGGGFDVIELPAGVYDLTRFGDDDDNNSTGDLDIDGSVTIRGPEVVEMVLGDDPVGAVIDGQGADRVFDIGTGITVTLENLTIRAGRTIGVSAPGGPDTGLGLTGPTGVGGGIRNQGADLTLRGCVLADNEARGGATDISRGGGSAGNAVGGGVYSAGPLTVIDTDLQSNLARGGFASGPGNGGLSFGGAIYAESALDISLSRFFRNSAEGGPAVPPAVGGIGRGGAIYTQGPTRIADTQFRQDSARGGVFEVRGTGVAPAGEDSDGGDTSTPDAYGGAIFTSDVADVDIERSTFFACGVLGGPGEDGGASGGSAFGGAVYHAGAALDIVSSTFESQSAGGGAGAGTQPESVAGLGGGAGGSASGGAIFARTPGVTITQSTLSLSGVRGGAGGEGQDGSRALPWRGPGIPGGDGGDALGAHLAAEQITRGPVPDFTLTNTILVAGRVTAGEGGDGIPAGDPGLAIGSGCLAQVASGSGNLESPSATCFPDRGVGDQVNVPGPAVEMNKIEDNGGPTPTLEIGPTSVAIDAAGLGACPGVDQRGFARLDGTCDVGAFERGAFEPIFSDGFESGDTFWWVEEVQPPSP